MGIPERTPTFRAVVACAYNASAFASFRVRTDNNRFVVDFRMLPLFNGSIKMIHIQMEDKTLFPTHHQSRSHKHTTNLNLSNTKPYQKTVKNTINQRKH